MPPSPRVFISHASEDKERFVNGFAEKLRQNGVTAWLDKWEMLPGDSLVDKIFEEGLKGTDAVIVVLSRASVKKPWVREELNASVIKRIDTGIKLIPVVIEKCEVPEALKSTVWQSIEDIDSYQAGFDRILAAIFGNYDKPPIGTPPAYTRGFVQNIGALTNGDSMVLRLACESAIETGNMQIDAQTMFLAEGSPLLPRAELVDSIAMLDQQSLVSATRTLGGGLLSFWIETRGFEEYAQACVPNYDGFVRDVCSALVNRKMESDEAIAADLQKPAPLVLHVLKVMEGRGHLKLTKSIPGPRHVYEISPSLKRTMLT